MSKNDKLINSLRAIAARNREQAVDKASNEMVPAIYAAIALALHRKQGYGYQRINDVFLESQKIWESFAGKTEEMVELCEQETGIEIKFENETEN